MKNYSKTTAAILGVITTIVSYLRLVDLGDFDYRGFPLPYYNGVWGMGMSYRLNVPCLFIDIVIWSVFWLLIIKAIIWLRKKYIAEHRI